MLSTIKRRSRHAYAPGTELTFDSELFDIEVGDYALQNTPLPVDAAVAHRRSPYPRAVFVVAASLFAWSFIAEYYGEYCKRASEREAALRMQPPAECVDLEKRHSEFTGSLVSYLMFQGKASMLETCKLYWDRYHLATGRSLWPSPLTVLTRMSSEMLITPMEILFSTLGHAALDLLQRLHLDDKIWFLVLLICLPVGLCYAYASFPRPRRVLYPKLPVASYSPSPKLLVTTDGLIRTFEAM